MTALGLKRGWTPFPNALIDLHMAKLTDTEWRVLVVVVRQTLGWQHHRSGRRRAIDRISQKQMKRRTGRESAAISGAIESLTQKGLVVVSDRSGKVIHSAPERRRLKQTLTFCLAPWIHSFSTETTAFDSLRNSKSEYNKRYLDKRKNKQRRIEPDNAIIK